MLVDMHLSLCRVATSLCCNLEAKSSISRFVANLLYVILGSYKSISADLNATMSMRILKLLELISPLDPNAASVWQCFLKVLATNTAFKDEQRLDVLFRLLTSILVIDPADRAKWLQLLRVTLKLNKYSLKKGKLSMKAIKPIITICQSLLPNDPLLIELLTLPIAQLEGIDLNQLEL